MSYVPSFKSGSWKAVCDRCGRIFKSDQLKQTWDGLMVCSEDWEARHDQDYVVAKVEVNGVPWSRKEPEDTYGNNLNWYCTDNEYCVDITDDTLTDYQMFGKTVLAVDIYTGIPFTHPSGYVYGPVE